MFAEPVPRCGASDRLQLSLAQNRAGGNLVRGIPIRTHGSMRIIAKAR